MAKEITKRQRAAIKSALDESGSTNCTYGDTVAYIVNIYLARQMFERHKITAASARRMAMFYAGTVFDDVSHLIPDGDGTDAEDHADA